MDFFAHQEQARKRSTILVVCYGLAVAAITLSVYAVLMIVFAVGSDAPSTSDTALTWWNADVALWTFLLVPGVILAGSAIKVQQLRHGGGARVAKMLGGSPVRADTRDADERKLLNVVEEMAIAAGVPVPAVFVMQQENGINAFAAGYSTRDAVIGVTRGCIENLSRDELQGVIAHEFSHIVNGDMRLNIRLIGVLFGIIMITLIGRILLRTAYFSGGGRRSSSGKKEGGNPLPILGVALIVIGYIGVFFANLIKSAISRQREFLADAAAVQFTRNPAGIASALGRIAKLSSGSRVANPHAQEAGHLFFGDCSKHFMSLFATHPPLAERIRRIDASGTWQDTNTRRNVQSTPTNTKEPGNENLITGDAELAGAVNLLAAQAIMRMMPDALEASTQDPAKARATLYALLWDEAPQIQQRQQQSIERLDPEAAALVKQALTATHNLNPALRLPLAERLLPALRIMPEALYPKFNQALTELSEANAEIDLFEFTIRNMVIRQLGAVFGSVDQAAIRHKTIASVEPQIECVLAAMARWGTATDTDANASYQAGMQTLSQHSNAPRDVSLGDVEQALDVLSHAAPAVKRQCMQACTATMLQDGNVATNQYELLRAIADALDIPMPPMQPTLATTTDT